MTKRVANADILPDSFNIFRRDRNNGQTGGGILLAVKQNITANVIDDTEINCEIILIEIQPLQGSNYWYYVITHNPVTLVHLLKKLINC